MIIIIVKRTVDENVYSSMTPACTLKEKSKQQSLLRESEEKITKIMRWLSLIMQTFPPSSSFEAVEGGDKREIGLICREKNSQKN